MGFSLYVLLHNIPIWGFLKHLQCCTPTCLQAVWWLWWTWTETVVFHHRKNQYLHILNMVLTIQHWIFVGLSEKPSSFFGRLQNLRKTVSRTGCGTLLVQLTIGEHIFDISPVMAIVSSWLKICARSGADNPWLSKSLLIWHFELYKWIWFSHQRLVPQKNAFLKLRYNSESIETNRGVSKCQSFLSTNVIIWW